MPKIVLEQPRNFVLGQAAEPRRPEAGEVLVRIHRVGVCGTDIHAYYGRQPFFAYPRILGHELGVEVVELGPDVTSLSIGDRCSVEPYLNCGDCIACRAGRTNCCASLRVLGVHMDGGMTDYLTLPAAKLHRSTVLALEHLALVETLAIGSHAVERAGIQPGEWALVIGAGPIGLAALQFARLSGARTIALDMNAERLALTQAMGLVDATLQPDQHSADALQALTGADLPTLVFDATGNARSMAQALSFVAPTGRLVFVGLVQGEVLIDDPLLHRREITLLASRNALPRDFTSIIAHMEAGRISVQPWITHRVAAAHFPEQFPGWLMPEAGLVKGVLSFA